MWWVPFGIGNDDDAIVFRGRNWFYRFFFSCLLLLLCMRRFDFLLYSVRRIVFGSHCLYHVRNIFDVLKKLPYS
jgi:hypothetical protein